MSSVLASKQWGSNALNLNGTTQEITLPLNINYAAAAVATMRSGDFPGYVCCPYWVTKNKTMGNDEGAYVMLPLTFPTKCVTALLSDTYGRLSNSSAMANQTEGAKVNAVTINSVQIISY